MIDSILFRWFGHFLNFAKIGSHVIEDLDSRLLIDSLKPRLLEEIDSFSYEMLYPQGSFDMMLASRV